MFYSQFILAKKGPLGTIWIAAHLERKLRKNQVADTDIGVSVDSIIFPEAPIALRLSSHLLLGVVRIYNRKVNYLFDDCSETLLKVKQAFRSTAVDLPPEESKAPYHSITLPETFDLDDFELPDSDIFQGNYVDHHISSREQITLQDTMEGVSYSTSKFGLDERFGDGDASGLDLDEELFLDKIVAAKTAEESADPQASVGPHSALKQEHSEDMAVDSETMVNAVDEYIDNMDDAQAPRTPGLVEEPNVQDASACDDHLESDYNLMESTMRQNTNTASYEDKEEVDWCSHDGTISDMVPQGPHEENGQQPSYLEIDESKPQEESPMESGVELLLKESSVTEPTGCLTGQLAEHVASGLADNFHKASDVPCLEDSQSKAVNKDKTDCLSVDETRDGHPGIVEIGLQSSASEVTGVTTTGHQGSECISAKDLSSLVVEVTGSVENTSDWKKPCHDAAESAPENKVASSLETPEVPTCQENADSSARNLDAHDKEAYFESLVLRSCTSILKQPDAMKSGRSEPSDTDAQSDVAALATYGSEEAAKLGSTEQNSKENQVRQHASVDDIHAASSDRDGLVHNSTSQDMMVNNLISSTEPDLPAPEKLLSLPEGHVDLHTNMLVEASPKDFEELDEGDAGSKTAAGRKRSFTESTLTEQSLNSVESSRLVRFKSTTESVPDDDDLLSSILVGRSSALKVKPTPRPSEVTSSKRTRSASRSVASKRKVLIDSTMVLHGDTIRQQLIDTEDIRRIRRKAPCTRAEISMIWNQHLEDEIFLETVFTGTSAELASLHSQVYDLSQIRVCQNDMNDAPVENDKNGVSVENVAETKLASHTEKYDASFETPAESYFSSPNNGKDDIENAKGFDETNVTEKSGLGVNTEILIVRDNEIARPCENSMPSEIEVEEVDRMTEQIKDTNNVRPDDSHQELSLDVSEAETHEINVAATNPAVIAEVEPYNSTGNAISNMCDASASMVHTVSLNESSEANASTDTDVVVIPDQTAILLSVGFRSADADDRHAIGKDEVTKKDEDVIGEGETEPVARNAILPDVDGLAVELVPDARHGEWEYNVQSGIHDSTHEEQQTADTSCQILEDDSRNIGEHPDHLEAYKAYMMYGETSGFMLHDHDEMNYLAPGNDTEFLNVDDDELAEMADDSMPDAEETNVTEYSGWSSRTKAVSKYLQTAFCKEAEYGRKSLSLDNLLMGKSRKEASRMFFETLVLKTRDYINVEQQNPFGDITIEPRTRLMKSDF